MKYIILLIPLIHAFEHDGITINITPGPRKANVSIEYEGQDSNLLTDGDLAAFNLTQDKIKKIVQVYSGEEATDVYNKSPTPWEDLYKSYNWREVKREFKVKDIKLANILADETNVVVKEYTNNATVDKAIDSVVHDEYAEFSTKHYWSGNIKVPAVINYKITEPIQKLYSSYTCRVGANFGSGITSVSYTNVGLQFNLSPGQSAKFYIIATKIVNLIDVEYETRLTGDLAVNYASKHEGHHFWAYDINDVLAASNMTSKVLTTDQVEVEYLTDFKYKVVDVPTGMDIPYKL